jgi:NitT/TauT family transport system permease protein
MVGAKAGSAISSSTANTASLILRTYFGILGITVIGLTFNVMIAALERRLMRWKAAV